MRVAAIVAMSNFPYWWHTIKCLSRQIDDLYVRYDSTCGDPEILRFIDDVSGGKLKALVVATDPWRCPEWREEGLRMLDDVPPELIPDIVLAPDQDEVFGDGLAEDLNRLMVSKESGLMFSYEPLESDDGRLINRGIPYPPDPHMKAFKYKRGLSYFPYHGDARIGVYHNDWIMAQSKIKHYAAWTQAMQDSKKWRSHTQISRGKKAVTLVGFGPSSKGEIQPVGEIWSLNNAYEALSKEAFRRCTRIFEMHQLVKRDDNAGDGKPHLWHLGECGKEGRRIILQEKTDKIPGSETYPLMDIIGKLGVNWFTGTPPYMLAMAILEGYNHIRVYGMDQMDWQHMIQRECFAGWVMYACGRGVHVDGELTFLKRHTKRYGYDYGPEWDDYQNEILWQGHPLEIKYKIESRSVQGKLYEGGK